MSPSTTTPRAVDATDAAAPGPLLLTGAIFDTARTSFDYDLLLDSLNSDASSDTPRGNAMVYGLVEILRLRQWHIDFRRFSRALPLLPGGMRFQQLLSSLYHLGYETSRRRVRGGDLVLLPPGSFVLTSDDRLLFPTQTDTGTPVLVDRHGGDVVPISPGRSYTCYLVSQIEEEAPAGFFRNSWITFTLTRFSAQNRQILFLTFLSNMLVVLASFSSILIFDRVIPARAGDTLVAILIGLMLLLYFDMRFRRIKASVIAEISARLEYIVSSALFEKLLSFRLEMFTAASSSDQMNKLKQFETVRDFFRGPVVAVIFELPFVAALLGTVFFINAGLGYVLLGVVLGYLVLGLVMYPKISRSTHRMASVRTRTMRLQEETTRQRDQIIQRGLSRAWTARIAPQIRNLSVARQEVDDIWLTLNTVVTVVTPLAIGAVVAVGATQVIHGKISAGVLVACIILSTRLLSPVQQALLVAVRMPDVINLFRQMDAMMALPGARAGKAVSDIGMRQGFDRAPQLRLDGVVFRYPRSTAPALRGVNLEFPPGSLTCVTGPSGSGKTTLLRLIMGHYRPQNGTVLIGSHNVDQFAAEQKTALIGHLGQKSLQIHGTIVQNLRLARPDATPQRLRTICARLGILDEIEAMPEEFETRLDYAFRQRLSPAFKTKFAVAQLLLKEPKVLLLDEPESGMSPQDHARVSDVLKSISGAITCIIVSQRPSVVREADRVVILNEGAVRFCGTPSEMEGKQK